MTESSEQQSIGSPAAGSAAPEVAPEVLDSFHAAWARGGDPASASPELLPSWLASICQIALCADAAGLSVLAEDYRVPIGASDDVASVAEQLQFTVGEGPCIDALRTGRPVRANAELMQHRWPSFHAGLMQQTPFRSVVATPLEIAPRTKGALDIYFRNAEAAAAVSDVEVADMGREVTSLLAYSGATADAVRWTGVVMPAWMCGPSARQRLRVWLAVGMVMWQLNLSGPNALAVLRAYAYSRDELLDDVSEAVIAGQVGEAALRP